MKFLLAQVNNLQLENILRRYQQKKITITNASGYKSTQNQHFRMLPKQNMTRNLHTDKNIDKLYIV